MRSVKIMVASLAVAAVVAWAAPVSAVDPVLTFTFSDLVGDFEAESPLFCAIDGPDTDGDVTRLDPLGDAFFDGAFINGFFTLKMNIAVGTTDPTQALLGDGYLTMIDVDGDSLRSPVSGVWIYNGAANFVGTILDLVIDSDDNEFNGVEGSASLEGMAGLLQGNVITVAVGNWFTDDTGTFQDFSDASTLAQGAVVPEPTALLLLIAGAMAAAGRRRRLARR